MIPGLPDRPVERLRWAIVASLLVNLLLWKAVAGIVRRPPLFDLKPVEISRIVLPAKRDAPKLPEPKRVPPRPRAPVVRMAAKPPPVRRALPLRIVRRPPPAPAPPRAPAPHPIRVAQNIPPPQGAHLKTLTVPDNIPPTRSSEPPALPGGNAPPGKPIEEQNPGTAISNPPVKPALPDPAPVKHTEPVKVAPAPAAAPEPERHVETAPSPPPQPEPPPASEKPRRKGPTRDAEPEGEIKPEIPDDLKHGDYKSFVRVRVDIDEQGNAVTVLRTSSGNTEIDSRVLEALKRWRWKPALKNGEPTASVRLFKFEFEVQ